MIEEILTKLSTYDVNNDATFETVVPSLLIRGYLITSRPEMKTICRDMINYISTNTTKSREMKTYFEYSCLVTALLLMKRVIVDEQQKNVFLETFYKNMDTYDMKSLFVKYYKPTQTFKFPKFDPNDYSSVRLSDNKEDPLNLFSINPLDCSLWFNWEQSNERITMNTISYINLYTFLFTKKPKQLTLYKLISFICEKDLNVRLSTEIKNTHHITYYHELTCKDEIESIIKLAIRKVGINTQNAIWSAIKPLTINITNSNFQTIRPTILNLLDYGYPTMFRNHKVIRKMISYHITSMGIIRAEHAEGSLYFLSNERNAESLISS